MKQASMTILAITALLGFTMFSYSSPDQKVTEVQGTAHWVNPDGFHGIAARPTAPTRLLTWTNPDGTHGSVEKHPVLAPPSNYSWANPEGYGSASMKVSNNVHHEPANLTIDIAEDNTPRFYEVTNGNELMSRLPFLGMLVAGVTFWLLRQLWPE
jgi:hypothetical protein